MRAVVVVLAVALAGSCERGDDPSRGPVIVAAGPTPTVPAADAGAAEPSDTAATTDVADAGETGPGDWGTLRGVCGPREGPLPVSAASGDEVQGIDDDTIAVGTVADPGFAAAPG